MDSEPGATTQSDDLDSAAGQPTHAASQVVPPDGPTGTPDHDNRGGEAPAESVERHGQQTHAASPVVPLDGPTDHDNRYQGGEAPAGDESVERHGQQTHAASPVVPPDGPTGTVRSVVETAPARQGGEPAEVDLGPSEQPAVAAAVSGLETQDPLA